MHETSFKADIHYALNRFTARELVENAIQLLNVLGYESQRTINRDANTTEAFLEDFNADNLINSEKALLHEWHTADAIIFDALGLTQGERDGVYEAVVNLVEARLRKARSLKGKG